MSSPAVKNTATAVAVPQQKTKHHAVSAPSLWLTCLAAVVFCLLFALGCWQVYRWQWKLDLIAMVEQRSNQAAQAPPPASAGPQLTRENAEYRKLSLHGRWLHQKSVAVAASTIYGNGYWVITPLQQANGEIILVNRGFVKDLASFQHQQQQLDQLSDDAMPGLLRLSETRSALFRSNDAANQRWYTRDVAAIAKAQGLHKVAPYFVDLMADAHTLAQRQADPYHQVDSSRPAAGLTVIHFSNNHVVYALTWFTLAIMVAGGYAYVRRARPSHGDD